MFEIESIEDIVAILEQGGLILFPTDTIWGIGCDATNPLAVEKICQLKKRTPKKGFVLLANNIKMVRKYVEHVHPKVDTLLLYHRRPLTVIYERGHDLAHNVLAPNGSVGIRIPNDDFCKKIIDAFGRPIVATSANISDEPFPGNFGAISSEIIQGVDYVVKYRQDEKSLNEPSVIVTLDKRGEIEFIRE